jgi:hypothetical protein
VFVKAGIPVHILSVDERTQWMKAAEPVYSNWLKDMKQKGLPADKTYDEFKKLMKTHGVQLPL